MSCRDRSWSIPKAPEEAILGPSCIPVFEGSPQGCPHDRFGRAEDRNQSPAISLTSGTSALVLKNVKFRQTIRMLRARVIRITHVDGWNLCGLQFVRPLI